MIVMKRILCPTDFSTTANNAIVYAAKFAQVTKSEIILFHVKSLFDLIPEELLKAKSEQIEGIRSIIERQAFEVAQTFKISCYAEVQVSGIALSTLINEVGSEFDLIIMGTNGPDDLYQFITGSNAYNVIRKAIVPVLLIPHTVEFKEIELAVLAYDYLREGIPPIEETRQLLSPFKYQLRVLQMLEESLSELQEAEVQGRQHLVANVVATDIPFEFDVIHTDNPAYALQSYIKANKADVLILHLVYYSLINKIFHKSLTKAMSVIADFPVLVFHSNHK
jgi:nucleotide-binding universal stress UspA family protein